jgi:hypothetical protein
MLQVAVKVLPAPVMISADWRVMVLADKFPVVGSGKLLKSLVMSTQVVKASLTSLTVGVPASMPPKAPRDAVQVTWCSDQDSLGEALLREHLPLC